MSRERAITAGGSDSSIRIWKIAEETQLIYNGHGTTIEAVRLINEENFFSSGSDGFVLHLIIWKYLKLADLEERSRIETQQYEYDEPIAI